MSLINDALRRAKTTPDTPQTGTPPPASSLPVPLVAVDPPKTSPWVILLLVVMLLVVLVSAGGMVIWFGIKKSQEVVSESSTETELADAEESAASTPVVTTLLAKSVSAIAAVTPAESNSPTPASMPQTHAPTASAAPLTPMQPPPNTPWPTLKLQGIYYRPTNPSALINGETVYLNDEIEGVRVVKIDAQRVTLARGNRTNVLALR